MNTVQELQSTVIAKDTKDNATTTATASASTNGSRYHITGVDASFSTSTTSGLLQLKDDTTVIWEGYVHGGLNISFSSSIIGTPNKAFSAVLAASGTGGVIGKVNVRGYLI